MLRLTPLLEKPRRIGLLRSNPLVKLAENRAKKNANQHYKATADESHDRKKFCPSCRFCQVSFACLVNTHSE